MSNPALPAAILLDADGVVWRGGEALPGAAAFIRAANAAGVRCILVSNNAGPDRPAYAAKCARLGLELDEASIFSVNYLAGRLLARDYPGSRTLVLGSEMLVRSIQRQTLAVSALQWLAERGLDTPLASAEQLRALDDARFDVVLCGIDINVSYAKLALACVAVERGAALIAANDDLSFPFEAGMTFPGNGSMVRLLAGVTGKPYVSLGKPQLHMLELIETETGIRREGMVMIGDRMETDIRFAQAAGMPSYLVLTGVTTDPRAADGERGVAVAADLPEVARLLGLSL